MTTAALVHVKDRFAWVQDQLGKRQDAMLATLPRSLPVERFTMIACNALRRNPRLLKCELQSLVDTVVFAADVGLEIGGPAQESYIVPFWNAKRRCEVATFIAGYRGLIKLATEAPNLQTIEAHVVRAGDVFDWRYGTDAMLRHVPGSTTKGEITHAWAMARFRDGSSQFEVMVRDEIDRLHDAAKAKTRNGWERSPWAQHTAEMARKSPVRRLAKYLNLAGHDRFHRAVEAEDAPFRDEGPSIESTERRDDLVGKLRPEPVEATGAVSDAEWDAWDDPDKGP